MGIEDIQLSEELETNAPSIKYRGEEGPGSPQEEQMIMLIKKLMSQGLDMESAAKMAQQMMAEAGQQQMPQQQMPQQMPRQMAAFGGIMGLDGRRKYGFGSSLKKFVRKIIPNEVSELAVKAAPFVAPFNAPLAGLMAGVGNFDQTGRIGSSLKAGLGTYAQGKIMSGIGGGGYQGGKTMNPFTTSNWTSPIGTQSGIGKLFKGGKFNNPFAKDVIPGVTDGTSSVGVNEPNSIEGFLTEDAAKASSIEGLEGARIAEQAEQAFIKNNQAKNLTLLDKFKQSPYVPKSFSAVNPLSKSFDLKQAVGAAGILTLGTKLLGGGPEETVDTIMSRGEGYDMDEIRIEVTEAFKDPSGKKLEALRIKYPYLGTRESKNLDAMAMGGRAGYMGGGMTMGGTGYNQPGYLGSMATRMPAAEGGLMDLGGMEKDYRAEGGFVPIGAKEKADDVPARLSVNEFVFTADAVRNAGGGDIDQGAEIMENMMKHLEQGGQVSEESQGMQGARDMFATSQRLGEVL